jgi:chromosome segregation ATPase
MFEAQEADRRAFYRSLGDAMDTIKTSQQSVVSTLEEVKECQQDAVSAMNSLVLLSRSQDGALTNMREGVNNSLSAIKRIEEATAAQLNSLNNIANSTAILQDTSQNISELLDAVSGISTVENDINAEVHRFKDILDGEVTQIEESMTQTNQLLTEKFDEFTELLKKSNTEALVEVMKHVTEEFQKQMNALISKLIQENFEKLNTSVEQLNTWQQENKEMIASLTTQYKEMADNFEATSTSLTQVKDDTTSLVSEGGKLRQIVDALNKVIVEDERFLEVTKSLQETANLSKDNMEKFDESMKALNDWVRKQRHFVEGVQTLITKLDELNKIRDYGEQFWSSTKEKMEQGVSIISNGTQELNRQLKSLDQQFYTRLSATLAELDNCITKMVDSVNKRR